MTITCAAILCVRNEALHLKRTISDFVEQGIDVVVIDHASTDLSLEICREFLGHGLLKIESMPWTGVFDLTEQLQRKKRIADELKHDWIIHADADEWLQSPDNGETLLEGIQRASGAGFSVINFDEFVFLPFRGQALNLEYYPQEILSYYFFAPFENRLMRAWKRTLDAENIRSGGHRISGDGLDVFPEAFILRHYIALSTEHATNKYAGRIFSADDLKKGWHANRQSIDASLLRLPDKSKLKCLPQWNSKDFDRSDPKKKHYWEWEQV